MKNVKGKEVLDDFYSRAEKEGFENIKNTYAYKYFDHVTGEEKMMRPKTGAGVERTFAVDSIAVATGTNTWAALPRFNGQAEYEAAGGLVIHSENYKKPEVFKDQNVLIVGAGESGSDICNEIADEAAKVAIAIRGKHGHLIPRKQADGRVTDLNTNRCRCAAAHTRAARVRPAPSRTPSPAPALRTSSRSSSPRDALAALVPPTPGTPTRTSSATGSAGRTSTRRSSSQARPGRQAARRAPDPAEDWRAQPSRRAPRRSPSSAARTRASSRRW